MIETKAALAAVKEIDEALGILAKALAKLKSKPDAAALKLAEALDEIAKTWQVMDHAIARFLSLGFDPEALKKGSEELIDIEGGALLISVERGRGHCHVIGNIFDRYLNKRFDRIFKGQQLKELKLLFQRLGKSDVDVFSHMDRLAKVLQEEANAVLDLIAGKQFAPARKRIMSMRTKLNPLRLGLNASQAHLYKLKGEFIRAGRIA